VSKHHDLLTLWANKLWDFGISPIPISPEAKRPLIRTSEWWGKPFPVSYLERFPNCNLAAQTGVVSRLIVVDIDNTDATKPFWLSRERLPRSWAVKTGGGGLHLWFRIPAWWNRPFSRTILWKGEAKHTEVAVLADRSMAICPPSKFRGSKAYVWDVDCNPLNGPLANAPAWLLKECCDRYYEPKVKTYAGKTFTGERNSGWSEAVSRIPDKIALYESWGLRIASRYVNSDGWMRCHRPGEEDRNASASVRPDNGLLWTSNQETFTLPQVAVILGAFLSEQECIDWVNERF